MNILLVGDVIGEPGRKALRQLLPALKQEFQPLVTIVNGENAAGGFGLTPGIAQEIYSIGADVITSGNHIWDNKQIYEVLDKQPHLLRPANYPDGVPGHGSTFIQPSLSGPKVGILNLEGRVFMHNLPDPFVTGRKLLEEMRKETPILIVDFHAEVTSEKRALGWYLDGLASAVIGTHTHVQTADEEILPKGTAYLTDMGMTGGRDSVIGIAKEDALHRFLYQTPVRFTPATNRLWLNGVVIDVDPATGKANSIQRIQRHVPTN